MPPSHLTALSHATSERVGVSGRLKKHGRLRPSIQKKMVDPRGGERTGGRKKEKERMGKEERGRETSS